MEYQKAVILGCGESLKEYKQADFEDAYVIGVNDAYFVHKDVHKKDPRMHLLVIQDQYQKALQAKPQVMKTPKEVTMRFVSNTWQTFADKRGNCILKPSWPHACDSTRIDDKRKMILNGHTSVTSALLQALQDGINELYLFGHDCSPGHSLHNKTALAYTFKELNFIATECAKRGGALYLASSSWLWNYKHSEGKQFLPLKFESAKKPRAKKATKKEID